MGEEEGQFLTIGDGLVADLVSYAGLQPRSRVLDVGSGYGRVAHALLRHEGFVGEYLGFDILPRHVSWCEENLAPLGGGRFRFIHLDVENARYNPDGTIAPTDAVFPADDECAEVVILTSVFTHVGASAIRRYLREIARVLTADGRALVTAFLIDEGLRRNEAELAARLPYAPRGYCRFADAKNPLHRIAYDDRWFQWEAEDAGLVLAHETMLGTWRASDSSGGNYQDVLVLKRAENTVL